MLNILPADFFEANILKIADIASSIYRKSLYCSPEEVKKLLLVILAFIN